MNRRVAASASLAALVGLGALCLRLPAPPAAARFAANALLPPARAEESAPPSPGGPAPATPPSSSPEAAAAPVEPADAHLVRSWRAPLAGGLLTFPPSFHSADGRYDLVIHLNGNTDLVEESYGYAGVNAVVMILNLGVGSGVYEDRFEDPAGFALILSRVQKVLTERGLRSPSLRRVAVSAWSSGYGGVIRLLQDDATFARIDALVLFDAIHCGYEPGTTRLKAAQIEPIRRFARLAAEGQRMLSVTHSDIATYGYLDAHGTTDAVLAAVGVPRRRAWEGQPMPALVKMAGVMPKRLMVPLTALTEAHRGRLWVRGYDGAGPITHMLHLVQMSTTALPDLVAYWKG